MNKRLIEKTTFITIYSAASIATFDLNKYIMENLQFGMHFLLVIIQCIIVGIIAVQSLFTKVSIRYSDHKKWYLISILLTAMMLTGMEAVFYFTPTVFTLYKNIAIIFTAIAEYFVFERRVTWISGLSFIVMIVSSIFGNTMKEVPFVGYLWMAGNVISTTAYVLYLKKLMEYDHSTRTESVLFTNLLSVPLVLVLSLMFDKFAIPPITFKLVLFIFLSGVTAYFTAFSTAWSMQILSSTTYSMIGALNKLALSASGFIFFDEKFEIQKLISLFFGIVASLIYSLDRDKAMPISQVPALTTPQNPS